MIMLHASLYYDEGEDQKHCHRVYWSHTLSVFFDLPEGSKPAFAFEKCIEILVQKISKKSLLTKMYNIIRDRGSDLYVEMRVVKMF